MLNWNVLDTLMLIVATTPIVSMLLWHVLDTLMLIVATTSIVFVLLFGLPLRQQPLRLTIASKVPPRRDAITHITIHGDGKILKLIVRLICQQPLRLRCNWSHHHSWGWKDLSVECSTGQYGRLNCQSLLRLRVALMCHRGTVQLVNPHGGDGEYE